MEWEFMQEYSQSVLLFMETRKNTKKLEWCDFYQTHIILRY